MCVIFYAEDKRPTSEMIEQAWNHNKDGGGVAHRKDGLLHWEKNLNLEEMQERAKTMEFPFVMHFRVASQGGVRPSLCHPFLVNQEGKNQLKGATKTGYVLFHNGDWGRWKDYVLTASLNKGLKIPDGKWSDTRAMAWLSSIYGMNFMEMIDQKGIVISANDIQLFMGSTGWKPVNGVWCSNDFFVHGTRKHTTCKHPTCHVSYNLTNGYCPIHQEPTPNREPLKGTTLAGEVEKTGGSSPHGPFHAIMRHLKKEYKAGKLTKDEYKRLKKRFNREREEMEAQARQLMTGQILEKVTRH